MPTTFKSVTPLNFVPEQPDDRVFMQLVFAKILELEIQNKQLLNTDIDAKIAQLAKDRGLWKPKYDELLSTGRKSGDNWIDHAKARLTRCGIHAQDGEGFYSLVLGPAYTIAWATAQPFLDSEFLQDHCTALYLPDPPETDEEKEITRKILSDSVYIIHDPIRSEWHKIGCSTGDCSTRVQAAKLWTVGAAYIAARTTVGSGKAFTVETGARRLLARQRVQITGESARCTLGDAIKSIEEAATCFLSPPVTSLRWHRAAIPVQQSNLRTR